MNFKKCSRCGSFYVANGDVCPNCNSRETAELETFKSYVKENGSDFSVNAIAEKTGILPKHINRFLGYTEFEQYSCILDSKEVKKK